MSRFMILFYDKDGASANFDRQSETDDFATWMGNINGITDRGAPFTLNAMIVNQDSVSEGVKTQDSPNGYCIIEAIDLGAAADLVKHCPVIANGGSLEVREIFSV